MRLRYSMRSVFLGASCVLAIASAAAAQAADVNVPAGDLATALDNYSKQSNIQLVYSDDDVRGSHTAGLHGSYAPDEALHQLLAGTNLAVHRNPDGNFVVARSDRLKNVQAASNDEAATTTGRNLESVVVTGTLIRGETPIGSDLTVYTKQDIQQSGSATLDQFARQMPGNFTGTDTIARASYANGGFGVFAQGAANNIYGGAGFNLNGLGAGSTLTLLNGHRIAPGGFTGQITDISQIPLTAIDHIDVLDDGASAIYGSDAVAGVVNIVTRKDFDGAETNVRYGAATEGGATETTASQTLGHSWSTGNVFVNYEYDDQSGLDASQRSYIGSQGGPWSLIPENVRNSVFVAGRQEIESGTTISADGLYSNRDFSNQLTENVPGFFLSELNPGHARQSSASISLGHDMFDDWHVDLTGTYSGIQQVINENIKEVIAPSTNITEVVTLASTSAISGVDGLASGSLFTLPGGDVKAAIGAGFRAEQFKSYQQVNAGAYTPTAVQRHVGSVYGEFDVPLIGEANAQPWAQRLELSAAGRFDAYTDFGSAFNPKFSVLWEPISDVHLRGTYGTSFQAPLLLELGTPTAFQTQNVPNTAAPGGTSDVLYQTGGNLNLRPETSRSTTFGFDFTPSSLPGASLSMTYFDVSFKSEIQTPSATSSALFTQPQLAPFLILSPPLSQVQAAFASPGFRDLANKGAAGVAAIFQDYYQNMTATRESGLSFSAKYAVPTSLGRFDFSLSGTDLLADRIQVAPTVPEIELLNTFNEPTSWKVRGGAGWTGDGFTARATLNYVGGYQNTLFTPPQNIGGWTTVDLYVDYDTGKESVPDFLQSIKIALSVQNLADMRPPFVNIPSADLRAGQNPIPYDSTNASPVGRMISVQLVKDL